MLTVETVLERLNEPDGAEKLFASAPVAAFEPCLELFRTSLSERERAQAATFLIRASKRAAMRDMLLASFKLDPVPLYSALESGSAKLRRNAARLMGELKCESYIAPLFAALEREDTRFVRPSILLALGSCASECGNDSEIAVDTRKRLEGYKVQKAADEADKKHESDELDALKSALTRLTPIVKHEFTGFANNELMELRVSEKLGEALAGEIEALKDASIETIKAFSDGVTVKSKDIRAAFALRSFYELLLPVARGVRLEPHAIARALSFDVLDRLVYSAHAPKVPIGCRIELRLTNGDKTDRVAFIRELASLLPKRLINTPSDYEIELRIEQDARRAGSAAVYIKLFTVKDERFTYRVNALPASILPANAAALMRYCEPYLTEGARVLDPCCGSGTLLFEREKLKPPATLTGVDIAHKAVDIARENATAGVSRAKFIVNDLARFEAERPFDEVIANLPFGNRVGTHESNEALYKTLADKLVKWLKIDGIAVLYTMESKLLSECMRAHGAKFELLAHTRTSAGGLYPSIFVFKRVWEE